MDNWLANIVGDVDSLHVEIDNLNNSLVGFCFIRSIDIAYLIQSDISLILLSIANIDIPRHILISRYIHT
jgi:hypothetical protein